MEKETFTSEKEIKRMLGLTGKRAADLRERAALVRDRRLGRKVYFRGLIEFSNLCCNDCLYCGIRNSNSNISRYTMTKEEIMESVEFCDRAGYASVVLQAGERRDDKFTRFICETVRDIKREFPMMAITLSVGEQSTQSYRDFYEAGAERYLLRIESSNPCHYRQLHPEKMDFSVRRECLDALRKIGYQVGTGVMIDSPFQTLRDLAGDLLFMKAFDVDMVGMGPYIPHREAPLQPESFNRLHTLELSLNMVAVLRLLMPDINIAAATAFQALDKRGREKALSAGANVIMPTLTPGKYRSSYMLYNNRPCTSEEPSDCVNCINERIESAGLFPALSERGDSLHFLKRTKRRENVCNC